MTRGTPLRSDCAPRVYRKKITLVPPRSSSMETVSNAIEGPRIADPSDGSLRCVRTDHDNISINAGHRVIRNAEIHLAIFAKSTHERTGPGIERDQAAPGCEEDSWKVRALTGPIRNTPSRRRSAGQPVTPDFLSRLRLERHDHVACSEAAGSHLEPDLARVHRHGHGRLDAGAGDLAR